ncbi:MAG: RseA family anti-sigma factor [Pseudomonadota bacterium]
MADELKEQLSALVDGELATHELEGAISRLVHDDASQQGFKEYHRIGDLMRETLDGSGKLVPTQDIRSAVADAIEHDAGADPGRDNVVTLPTSPESASEPPSKFAPLAIAATVLLGVAVAFAYYRTAPELVETASTAPGPVETAPVSSTPAASTVRWSVSNPAVEARLRRYMVSHSEYSGRSMQGMHPYARVVVYQQ